MLWEYCRLIILICCRSKKRNPLIVGIGKNGNYIASDIPAILKYTVKY